MKPPTNNLLKFIRVQSRRAPPISRKNFSIMRSMTGIVSHSIQGEVVDDSEPEREEWRRQEKGARKKLVSQQASKPPARDIIELTDNELDSTDISHEKPPCASGRVLYPQTDVDISERSNERTLDRPPRFPALRDRNDESTFHSDEDDVPEPNFARFAFASAVPTKARAGPSRTNSSLSVPPDDKIGKKKKPAVAHRFPDFSSAEIAGLTRCVSCDIRWTARKTGAQKLLHVQSCAKKHSFNDETIRVLIRKEIDSTVGDVADAKRKSKHSSSAGEPLDLKTFFEDIVAHAAPKKKTRRLEPSDTVKSVADTRDVILYRARAVLGSDLGHLQNSESRSVHTQSIGQATSHEPLPSTQLFGESALAQRHRNKSSTASMNSLRDSCIDEIGTLPSTQAFAPSKLGLTASPKEQHKPSEQPSHSNSLARALSQSDFNQSPGGLFSNQSLSYSMNSSRREPVLPQAQEIDLIRRINVGFEDAYGHANEVSEWGGDGAYLHFEPEGPLNKRALVLEGFAAPKRISPIPSETQRFEESCTTRPCIPKVTPKKRAVEKARRNELEQEDDDHWESFMKERITHDHSLHHRILRYEPIHFDVFMKLADDGKTSHSGKFKARLRSFLDRQAINFYGAESTGRRR